jgi:hypothetical protein
MRKPFILKADGVQKALPLPYYVSILVGDRLKGNAHNGGKDVQITRQPPAY